jgi:colanic acid biosynthesis glycosyl transferase WcaI
VRILIVADRYPPEARSAAVLYQELAEELVRRGHGVSVVTKMPTDYVPGTEGGTKGAVIKRSEKMGGVSVVRVSGWSSFHASIAFRALQQVALSLAFIPPLMRVPRPDVLLVYSPPLFLAATVGILGRLRRIPCVLNLHDIYPRTAIQLGMLTNGLAIVLARLLEAFVYNAATAIVVPARGSRTILVDENAIPQSKIHVVPNWVDTDSFLPASKNNNFRDAHGFAGSFVVTYAGVMGFVQDLTTIIECARRMQGVRDIIFLLIGDGVYADRWKALAGGLSNVRFLPMLPKETYFDALAASNVGLVALSERLSSPAIPGKVQSIMAVGCPIVATVPVASDAANIIVESKSGFVVAPGDVTGLCHILDELMRRPALGEELGRNGRTFAERHFSLSGAVTAYERIFKRALQHDRHS